MKSESDISQISLCSDESSGYFATIHLESGQIQRPSWKGLYRYWNHAKAIEVEYFAASYSGHYAVFSFSVASGQGGIIAIWNTFRKRWEHVSEANYVACAMLLQDVHAVVSLHYISCWGVCGHHAIYATPMNRTLDGYADIALPIAVEFSKQVFDSKKERIMKAAYGDYTENDLGPLGIFLLADSSTLLAHDSGKLYKFSVKAVAQVLNSKGHNAERGVSADADEPRR
jgi:hypothetical protein